MLWDIIRDFIVQNITGGTTSTEEYYGGLVGYIHNTDNLFDAGVVSTDNCVVPIGSIQSDDFFSGTNYISMGDWLATTLTIIAMCLIVAFAIWLVRWVFKAVTSAFLLRR